MDGYEPVTAEQIEQLLKKQRYRCAWCHTCIRDSATQDHRKALSNGGRHTLHNIELVCLSCNSRKRSKDEIRWANENGRLL